jgi:hypothetical protein
MANPAPVRFPNGVANRPSTHAFGRLNHPDVSSIHRYFNDFDTYAAGDWTLSKNGGTGTQALAAGDGGWLVMTNSAGATDMMQNQLAVATYSVTAATSSQAGKDMWFGIRFKTDSASLSTILVGLYTVKTTAATTAPTDGFWFKKTAGAAAIDMIDSTGSTLTATSTGASMADDTFIELAFHYFTGGAANELRGFVNGVQTCSRTIGTAPTGNLALSFVQNNSSAVARTMTVDWVKAVKER